jgi:hypothetical protein
MQEGGRLAVEGVGGCLLQQGRGWEEEKEEMVAVVVVLQWQQEMVQE